jgi:hypothetical protein
MRRIGKVLHEITQEEHQCRVSSFFFLLLFLLLLLALFLSGYRGEYIWFNLWTCTLGMYLLN